MNRHSRERASRDGDDSGGGGGGGDTIAAIATAAGVGGVGIVRISGPRALAIGAALLGCVPDALDRTVRVGWVRDAEGARVDQVLAFAMRAPGSFTGEDVVELQGHGGPHNLAALLAAVVAGGARVAEPGEFTRRAVAAGKLDLTRAEALLAVIHAGSERAWRLAQGNLSGQLGAEAARVEQRALAALAELEGEIDFPEADLDVRTAAWVEAELRMARDACAALASGFAHGRAATAGIVVALVGEVNAGKSSLLNALVGTERALVAETPGTTRDWLEVNTTWNGIAVTLVDTAGLRETSDPVEQRGIALGAARVASADVVLVLEAPGAVPSDLSVYGDRALRILTKSDLAEVVVPPGRPVDVVSAGYPPPVAPAAGVVPLGDARVTPAAAGALPGPPSVTPAEAGAPPVLPSVPPAEAAAPAVPPSVAPAEAGVHLEHTSVTLAEAGVHLERTSVTPAEAAAPPGPRSVTPAEAGVHLEHTSVTPTAAAAPPGSPNVTPAEAGVHLEHTSVTPTAAAAPPGPGARSEHSAATPPPLATSAVTGAGLAQLRAHVLAVAGVAEREGSEHAVVTTTRQHALVTAARDLFAAALAAHAAVQPPELVAVDLRGAVTALAQLRGVEVGERVLDELFARFCIGK